ncbi:MAG: response regulator [Deltaproteobacteria bacterium]|nr:response regulator [Deltaproteobacteria bacterium]
MHLMPVMWKIAIIDDDASERLVLRGFIEDAGHVVAAEAADGARAVDICRANAPDLMILDVRMPGMDGIEAIREINGVCPTACILLTASEDEATIRRSVEAGAMAYLVKPVRGAELLAAIELAVARFNEFKLLRKENNEMKAAIQTRKKVEKAKGLLMEREGLSENEAFVRIRKISMDKRKGMAEVADVIIMALEGGGK